ncbi:MAG TPA: efflux transporter outer membrane subunit [Burkholderiaceae bacterium]|jgi:NodT family efflux transporter outer membrane factor (OMF) lipoprotein|nr:efflux transporter outer membrane subunit [Burkholderiaceae bacterium]
MTSLRSSFLLASALWLGACAVGPNYQRPAVDAPAAFKEAPAGWKPAEPQDAQARTKWWEIFGDSELSALVERVAGANQTLREALANYNRAQALARQARAGFFPTLSANVNTSRGSASASNSVAGRGTVTSDQASLSAAWEPDLWGRVRRSVESENASVAASRADLESSKLSLQAQVVQNYFQLRVADAQRALLDEAVQAYARSLELTRNRYTQGVVTRADVVQAQAQLASAQAQWTEVDIARAQLEHAIATLVGVAPSALTIVPKPELAQAVTLPTVPGLLPSQLLERRPDIAGAERRVAAANAQIGVAQAAWFPVLDLSGTYGYRSTGWANLLSAPNRVWSLGASLVETIFDGGARSATVDAAVASYDASVASYRQTVLSAFQEVEDNLTTLRVLADEANYQREAVRAARESLDLTTNQYKAGTVSYLNVITAQTTLLGNQQNELNLRSRQLVASAVLIRALGGGWQAETTADAGAPLAGR